MGALANPLPSWSPPDSASGPQNNNVIQYGAALGNALGCDPIKGCGGGTVAEVPAPQSGQSLGDWINGIIGGAPASASTPTATNAPATPGFWQTIGQGALAGLGGPLPPQSANTPGGAAPTLTDYFYCIAHPGDTSSRCNSSNPTSALSFGRIAAFILGLIGIAGAVYLFKEA
jgi:hypothetical protein